MNLDKNGYAPSIMPPIFGEPLEGVTVRHEIYFGKNREISKANGFWINIPWQMHEILHNLPDKGIDKTLKRICQKEFEKTHSRAEFMALIGKNYLED